jgi:N-acetylmuramoyl-L-alanine amidase
MIHVLELQKWYLMSLHINRSGCITGQGSTYVPSPNFGAFFEDTMPDTIVIHYTAMDSAESAITRLCDPVYEVSAHVLISRDGYITQMVSCNRIAWHAGVSYWNGRNGLNQYALGIELDNAGLLEKKNEHFHSTFGGKYSEDEVEEVKESDKSTYWHKYSEYQLERLISLCWRLRERYGIKEILGHSDVSPGRKIDPGPVFPMAKLKDETGIGCNHSIVEQ